MSTWDLLGDSKATHALAMLFALHWGPCCKTSQSCSLRSSSAVTTARILELGWEVKSDSSRQISNSRHQQQITFSEQCHQLAILRNTECCLHATPVAKKDLPGTFPASWYCTRCSSLYQPEWGLLVEMSCTDHTFWVRTTFPSVDLDLKRAQGCFHDLEGWDPIFLAIKDIRPNLPEVAILVSGTIYKIQEAEFLRCPALHCEHFYQVLPSSWSWAPGEYGKAPRTRQNLSRQLWPST